MDTVEIKVKLPSLNEYIRVCRANKYMASKYKAEMEETIGWYLLSLPRYDRPVKIHFHWMEDNKRRDLDNVAFAKKFILDALVKTGKLKDDNRRYVVGFMDTFEYTKEPAVRLYISEVNDNDTERENTGLY